MHISTGTYTNHPTMSSIALKKQPAPDSDSDSDVEIVKEAPQKKQRRWFNRS
jgi:hypothetical protein